MVVLNCRMCGVSLDAEDDFEAGMFAAWHLHASHRDVRPDQVQYRDERGNPDQPAAWSLEHAKPQTK